MEAASGLYGFSQMGVGATCTALVSVGSKASVAAAIVPVGAGIIGQTAFWVALRHRAAATKES